MKESPSIVHIGSGAGFAGDRFDAAVPVVKTLPTLSGPRYLIYEVMAERTLAIAQKLKIENPQQGYSPWLDVYLPEVLADCQRENIKIVANFGNANPKAAAQRVLQMAAELKLENLTVAIVEGDDLLQYCSVDSLTAAPCIEGTSIQGRKLLAANAYLGARPVAQALDLGVDIVLVGRTTDAALVLGPLIHEFGWLDTELDLLAAGTLAGHLLECGSQVSGGYFADPGMKNVPDLDQVGFPIADISHCGRIEIGKALNTGGRVSRATVSEQMLYEVHDPANYLTPDVALDITGVSATQLCEDRVLLTGVKGKQPPDTFKVTLSVEGGWLGEAEVSYAGPNALARAKLAADVVRKRVQALGIAGKISDKHRIEILGTGTVHDDDSGSLFDESSLPASGEYRIRAAIRCTEQKLAKRFIDEVLALLCCGPAGGGGARQSLSSQVSTASMLWPRDVIEKNTKAIEITHF